MNDLTVTIIQTGLHWQDRPANRRHFSRLLQEQPNESDLIILPEMFTTGFTMEAAAMGETMEGATVEWLAEQAAGLNTTITGSFIAKDQGKHYNRLLWMPPDGQYQVYDKKHLFTLAGEQHHYSPGHKRLVTELKGWKILPIVCYDLRFPVWCRNQDDYDLMICVANWPDKRSDAWRQLLIGRAIENQAYTIGVNRVGYDGNDIYYSGHSCIIDYAGQALCKLAHLETSFTTNLSAEQQHTFRRKFRFLADRDAFTLVGDQ